MLIRHPALTFPSLFRASKEAFGIDINHPLVAQGNSYRMDRTMYDWYKRRLKTNANNQVPSLPDSSWPLVLDMQDMVNDRGVMRRFCLALGLDPEHLRYEWKPAPREYVEKQKFQLQVFLSSIQASAKVLAEKAPQVVNMDVEYSKWVEEWGMDDATVLKNQVETALEDYQYLWSRRIMA